jgi:cell division protein FtsW
MRRFTVYRNPEQSQNAEGYQLWHSQLALGSGGLGGLGFTRSRMKQHYLPEAHTDFIVAIVGEELGFAAVAALILVYCLLVGAVLWAGALSGDRTGVLLCVGVALSIGFQAFVNISVVSGFCPTTGVTAPFLSYGGSSMLALMTSIGLVLNVTLVSESQEVENALDSRYSPALPPREAAQLATRIHKRRS